MGLLEQFQIALHLGYSVVSGSEAVISTLAISSIRAVAFSTNSSTLEDFLRSATIAAFKSLKLIPEPMWDCAMYSSATVSTEVPVYFLMLSSEASKDDVISHLLR